MSEAGVLATDSVVAGVTAAEIAQIAVDSVGQSWTVDGCTAFVWGVTNLAGAPFLDLRDMTVGNDPTRPLDDEYVVPHSPNIISGIDNIGGDGWITASTTTNTSALKSALQVGDVVRVYKQGNSSEVTFLPDGSYGAHSFVVTSISNGEVWVTDNWTGPQITTHNFDDIADAFAPSGNFEAAFVSRLDEDWVSENFPDSIGGNGYGDFSDITTSV